MNLKPLLNVQKMEHNVQQNKPAIYCSVLECAALAMAVKT